MNIKDATAVIRTGDLGEYFLGNAGQNFLRQELGLRCRRFQQQKNKDVIDGLTGLIGHAHFYMNTTAQLGHIALQISTTAATKQCFLLLHFSLAELLSYTTPCERNALHRKTQLIRADCYRHRDSEGREGAKEKNYPPPFQT